MTTASLFQLVNHLGLDLRQAAEMRKVMGSSSADNTTLLAMLSELRAIRQLLERPILAVQPSGRIETVGFMPAEIMAGVTGIGDVQRPLPPSDVSPRKPLPSYGTDSAAPIPEPIGEELPLHNIGLRESWRETVEPFMKAKAEIIEKTLREEASLPEAPRIAADLVAVDANLEDLEYGQGIAITGGPQPMPADINAALAAELTELNEAAEEMPPPPTDDDLMRQWEGRLGLFRRNRIWLPSWGPRPGQAGCAAPLELLLDHEVR